MSKLQIDRLTLDQAVARTEATLAVEASYHAAKDEQRGTLHATAIGTQGTYTAGGEISATAIRATLSATEASGGMIARAAGVPDIGAITLNAGLNGPRDAIATKLAVTAGQLQAAANGTVDLAHDAADLTVTADAPAMHPAPDLAWQSVAVHAHVAGPFTTPKVTATGRIAGLTAGTAAARLVTLNAAGDRGAVQVTSEIDGLSVPGTQPDLFAAAPVRLTADATLNTPERPVRFTLQHPLLSLTGTANTGSEQSVKAQLDVPALAPLAVAFGQDVQGTLTAAITASRSGETTTAALHATLGVTGGRAPCPTWWDRTRGSISPAI